MKTQRRLISAVLLVSMLLSLFGGSLTSAAAAQAVTTVTTDRELAYEPLTQTASVAYEQHEDGYAVSLDRSANDVTMNITAVPGDGSSRAAEKARLYIHTGVTLKPNTAYRVSFSLWAKEAQPEYAVCFDGGSEESAYGTLDGRGIEADGRDQVQYQVTPEAEHGELILRLLLGKTGAAGNKLRFSNLAVEEVSANEVGNNVVLTDNLDYNAPGFIRLWTNDDSKAAITSDKKSATLTVIQAPARGAEVWKIKLLVATGLTSKAGKTYRFTADVVSTAAQFYELCYNEGDTEKGFGAEYSQRLTGKPQTLDYTIHIPEDKENPGELIIQFSLGNLKTGDKVTISNIALTEASPSYVSMLSGSFSFNEENTTVAATAATTTVTGSRDAFPAIDWDGTATASKSGDDAGDLTILGGSATLEINGGTEPYHARLNIDTGASLEAGTTYRVSFKARAVNDHPSYEVRYGTALKPDSPDNNEAYGSPLKGLTLAAGEPDTVRYQFTPEKAGGLLISLSVGATDGNYNEVTVSGIEIAVVEPGAPSNTNLATSVEYPSASQAPTTPTEPSAPVTNPGSFSVRADGDYGGTITGDGESATMTCTGGDAGDGSAWKRGMFTGNICRLSAGSSYRVSFDIEADEDTPYEVCYNKDGDWGDNEKGFGWKGGLNTSTDTTATYDITAAEDGTLRLRIDLGRAKEGTEVTVSNIQVRELKGTPSGGDLATVTYSADSDHFHVRADVSYDGSINIVGASATMTCTGGDAGNGSAWKRGMFTGDICRLSAGSSYRVSFDIEADEDTPYEVCYNKDGDWGDNEKGFGWKGGLNTSTDTTATYDITAAEDGTLRLRIDLGRAEEGTQITVSNIKVQELELSPSGDDIANMTYPSTSASSTTPADPAAPVTNPGTFSVRAEAPYGGSITGDGDSATMTCTGGDAGDGSAWKRGMFTGTLCRLSAGHSYQVSFDITATKDTPYEICYNKDKDWNEGEKGFGWKGGLTASTDTTATYTVTPVADGDLRLRIDLGRAKEGTQITVSNIKVQEIEYTAVSTEKINGFGSVWAESIDGYTADLTKGSDYAKLHVTKPADVESGNWRAKLFIRTGVAYHPGKAYRAIFDITAENAQKEFCVISQGVPDSEDIRGTWGLSIGAGETKTITTRPIPAGMGTGELILQIELGKLDGTENTFTVSNVRVEEVDLDINSDYLTDLICRGFSADLDVTKSPIYVNGGLEPGKSMDCDWMLKLFVDTGVYASKGDTYRVTFNLHADESMNFGVCYNRDGKESGYGSVSGLHAARNKETTVEHFFTASKDGSLILQLMLGDITAPNTVSVSKLKVEDVTYSYAGKSALPAEVDYRAPSAVSYWVHADYATTFTGSDKAITANIKSAPSKGAEFWKIKLFLDTGTPLQAGKYYKVTANVKANMPQDYEICYNNGGIEMGYDALGGLRLVGGETQTVERIISVPAGKTDINNLTLQFNLGKTTVANAITVSGVKVEEAALSYTDVMAKDFAYTAGSTVNVWTNSDYTAKLESSEGKATLHITDVPSAGAEVWKVKLLVSTGAILSAGKTYLVRANLAGAKAQNYELCFNNEETEKGFDAFYNQSLPAGQTVIEKKISVPDSMTDAGELVLQFSVGGAVANDITVSNVSVKELSFGASGGNPVPDTVIGLYNAPQTAAGTLDVSRGKLTYKMTKISSQAKDNAIEIAGADLRSGDLYTVAFTARADKELTGTFTLNQANSGTAVLSQQFKLTAKETAYSFTTEDRLSEGGLYDLLWQFGSANNQKSGGADVEISNISVYSPPEKLQIIRGKQNVTVNGKKVTPDTYNINGNNYIKLRDLALLLNDTDGQFVVRYNSKSKLISLTTGKPYTPVGGELTMGADRSATCVRSPVNLTVNGKKVNLKAYNLGKNNFFRLRDLSELLGFKVDYVAEGNAAAITSPLTPEAQEKGHAYDLFFLPEIDGESQPYVGDTMPFYDNGVYYTYYLKDGGDSYNHSVYVTTTTDFVKYKEYDNPVLSASREDVQDNWIGTGSVVKVEDAYYFFYTGFNASGSQEYHEKIMVAKGSSPTSFEKVSGWEIVPPAELGQKNDFRDPQAYYDPASKTISLTVTTNQDGKARIVKYTLGKDLQNVKYDGIIYTDPTGEFWNLECSDTFKMGNKWYLTYSGQDDTLWYAMADSRFGPYTNASRLEGKLFYAAKHVEDGKDTYMVGWARRANSASSTQEVNGWAGNLAVQKLYQKEDGSLALVPVDSIVSAFHTQKALALGASEASLKAGSGHSYKAAFTSYESFTLSGEFTYSGAGSFGLAFDFNGKEDQYKLISLNPASNTLSLAFNEGATLITETQAALHPNQTHSFTYIQDGSVGIFYLDNQAALLVRLYGVTDKPIYLFAENNSVTFTSLRQYTQ